MKKLTATLDREHRQVRIGLKGSPVYYWFSLASSVDTTDCEEACSLESVEVTQEGQGEWEAVAVWKSDLWHSKKHFYRFEAGTLIHWVEVNGKGAINALTYGSGTVDDAEEACIPGFGTVYTGTPNFLDKPWSHPSEYTAISAGNVTELWGSALNGGPLMFAFGEQGESGWIGSGILAKPGQYGFQTLAFNCKRSRAVNTPDSIVGTQAFTLDYLGNEQVDGHWVSPKLILFAGKNAPDCLQRYCKRVYAEGCASNPPSQCVDWWKKPIFCTWHEQVALGRKEAKKVSGREDLEAGTRVFDQITEQKVRRWLALFEERDIYFGTLIFDAMWQKDVGSNVADLVKFPDLRGFIDELHTRGYRVILWVQAWEMTGIPADWCVTRDGNPVMADPTHPKYREYVQKMVMRLLGDGPGCYHADGLKIDGTSTLPGGIGLKSRGELYGFELLHAYLKLMYDASKAAKEDALVSLFGANPYMADCCDMVRLGDLYTSRGDPIHAMRSRAETFRAGLPHALLETDGALRFSVRDDLGEILAEQAKLGILCIYQAEYLYQNRAFMPESVRKLNEADYDAIRTFVSGAIG